MTHWRIDRPFERGLALWLALVPLSALAAAESPDDAWPRFRGPGGSGISSALNLPAQWSESGVRWKIALPGKGHSSPVIWKGRIYLTSGDEKNATRHLLCVRTSDGQLVWVKPYPSQVFPQNRDNSYGSSTPAVDDQGVYGYWTTPEEIAVVGLTLDGQEKWRRNLGPFVGKHGSGASPVIMNRLVWINNDQDGPSSLLALDTVTGQIKYKIERIADKVSYGTPCLFARNGRPEELIVASSSHGLTSIDPLLGKVNWDCTNLFKARIVSSPITSDGLIICSSGEGGVGRRLVALRPPTNQEPATIVYGLTSGIPNVPTPLAKDGRLFLVCDNGLIRCLRTATGEPLWQHKLTEEFYGSPVWAQGRLYVTSKSGTVFVLAAQDTYQLLGTNSLGEPSFATPALAKNTLYFRTVGHLIAVGPPQP